MAYRKPGVEVSQVQQSATPIFTDPDLRSVIVGPGYHIQPLTDVVDAQGDAILYSGVAKAVNFSDINSDWAAVDASDTELVIVDLVGTKGSITGQTFHLVNGLDFTASTSGISISGSLSEVPADAEASIKVSYRSLRADLNTYSTVESQLDIETKIGTPVSYNPLAYGCSVAMANAGSSIGYYGTQDETVSKFTTDAISALELEEVYCIAPMTHLDVAGDFKSHCESMSSAVNKKERIAIINREITASNADYRGASENKGTVAGAIRDANAGYNSKRLVSTHPDFVYDTEVRHISTLKNRWIETSFDGMSDGYDFTGYGLYARFTGTTVVGDKTYYA